MNLSDIKTSNGNIMYRNWKCSATMQLHNYENKFLKIVDDGTIHTGLYEPIRLYEI